MDQEGKHIQPVRGEDPVPRRVLRKSRLTPEDLKVEVQRPTPARRPAFNPSPPQVPYFDHHLRMPDFAAALVVAVVAFVAVSISYSGFGLSWDEAMYRKSSVAAAGWLVDFTRGDPRLMAPEEIHRVWSQNPEIAPIPKLIIGAGEILLGPRGIDPLIALRLPIAGAFALTVALIFMLGTRCYGRTGGFAAAVAYVLMPRVFGHAHIAASETLLALTTVMTVGAYLWGISRWQASCLAAIALALAINTKVTALLLPVPLFLWGQLYRRRENGANMFAILFLTPLFVVLTWPWLWTDTVPRFLDYLKFYIEHQVTAVFFNGRMWGYGMPPAPWTYPWVIATVAVPEWILVFVGMGLIRAAFQSFKQPVQVLFVLMAVFPLLVSSMPGAPKYDGERLFFQAFAFVALLAGGGFAGLATALSWGWRSGGYYNAYRAWLAGAVLAVVGAWGIVDLVRSHPNELNYFNRIVGGPKGAYDQGFETSYWGEALNDEAIDWLNNNTRPGQKVLPLAMNEQVFDYLQEWKKLRGDVDFTPDAPPYDFYLLQVRQGFIKTRERILRGVHKPMMTFAAQDVPRLEIYPGTTLGEMVTDARTTATATQTTNTASVRPADTPTTPPASAAATTVPLAVVTTPPGQERVTISDSQEKKQ